MTKYYKEILNYVSKLTGDAEKAKDVTQETYLRAISAEQEKDINRSFLYKTAKNIVIDYIRKRNKDNHVEFIEEIITSPKDEQPEEVVLSDNHYENIMKIVDTLPKRSKEAFLMHSIDGYERKEIAQKMGISQSAVEKLINRAIKNLQEKLITTQEEF
ncbi:RNA polymerase sigma factor [Aliarcobacter vitoriensis]|uniref:RNA polymerase subunit sigma n=1 Tax=Aliarcobacter vitoriensis TaxID=2011099 RepID=A0A366MTM8_9BACT|nr:sigma-70 family RNA polymerase sigma factor [Aliarcobacter vitoriensis]RBQ28849.1 RNA polymerase subunit sigma [Aliarcobacter vitoriensis]RBQ31104.1 RNA polymerase subunit sigma [Arcobacter sp. FW59]